MKVFVMGNLENALTILRRKVSQSGILRELKTRSFAKASSRSRYKKMLAAKRREKNLIKHYRRSQ